MGGPDNLGRQRAVVFCVAFGAFAGLGVLNNAHSIIKIFNALQLATELGAVKIGRNKKATPE
jgi:hypothetical protein